MAETTNSIIEFYKKANEAKSSLVELPTAVEQVLEEAVTLPLPTNTPTQTPSPTTTESEDPFKKFVNVFTNIVKEAQEKEPAKIIEAEIKQKTIEFISKLKEGNSKKQLPEKLQKKIKTPLPELKQEPKKNKQEELKENIKEEPIEDEVVIPTEKTNLKKESNYIEQLRALNKERKKTEFTKPTDIKSLITQQVNKQVQEAVQQIQNKIINTGMGGGGGGTNAVQYAKGGTMNGDLNVTGKYLSGGVDIATLFSSSSSANLADRLVSSSEAFVLNPDGTFILPNDTLKTEQDVNLTLMSENSALSAYTELILSPYAFVAVDKNHNSISFDSVDNTIVLTTNGVNEWKFNDQGDLVGPDEVLTIDGSLSVSNHLLSGGRNLDEIFLTAETDSQTLAYNTQTELLSISNGNTVSLSSLNDKSYIDTNFLNLTGGVVTNNLTVQGNISALGTATFANTIFTTTSSLSVVNTGPGPALYVYQAAGPYDVASFYDGDGIEVLHVGNAGPGGLGKVGVNESFPNKELTVKGSISATESIFATSILSGGVDLADIFLTSETDSQTLAYNTQTELLSISNGNAVSLSSLNDKTYVQSNFLNLTGGIITNNLTIQGNISATQSIFATSILSGGVDLADIFLTAETDSQTLTWNSTGYELSISNGNTISLGSLSSTGGATPIKRFDYVTVANIDYSYSGSAPYGTLDNNPIWKLIRLTYNNNGTVSNQASAIDSWTGHLTAAYI